MCFIRSFLSIICCLLCLASCISTSSAPYPDSWPKTETSTDSQCPELTGAYSNQGLDRDGNQVFLADIFFPLGMNDGFPENFERVAVSLLTFEYQGEDALVVKAWVGSELWKDRQVTATQLPCRKGQLVYHSDSWGIEGRFFITVIAHGSFDHLMTVVADGSLVIEKKQFTMGIATILPLVVTAQTWSRFPPQSSSDSPAQSSNVANPGGLRSDAPPVYRLLPPEGASGHDDAQACVESAKLSAEPLDAQKMTLLEGRSTQAFLYQYGGDGALVPYGHMEWTNWIPATHDSRIEKLNWQLPLVADHYVICLLRKGYRWEEPAE